MIFDNYCRSEVALIASMAEMVVNGVSTRKVSKVVETLCGLSVSKSAVSDLYKELDEAVNAFKNRSLTDHYPFVVIDATYFKVLEDHIIISKAFMVAYATYSVGHRDIIGFGAYANESRETWLNFLSSLKRRGLKDVAYSYLMPMRELSTQYHFCFLKLLGGDVSSISHGTY